MFKYRSYHKELLDADAIPDLDLARNLQELNTINSLLGGYGISLNALTKVLKKNKAITLVDIGCGGGDALKQISCWAGANNYNLQLYGVDLKPFCVAYAQKSNALQPPIKFICADYRDVLLYVPTIDVLHACLFCHHLSENEIIELINFACANKIVLVINDLERNAVAYYAIKWLTAVFSRSYLVKNDAPLSVLRGFKKHEWKNLLEKSSAINYSIKNKWAFRHQIIIYE